ncbi:thiol reductant ABC exporter subunit CydC [Methylopila sp. Yamaguchi]|uniref:thiol reductant ABC exporter subunit CydC n=1 Tax=Methylopila sp. Yamaguchi TaxID=1437817 RepID=UPI000CC4388F|nr:thiol reductant ABC exporter subunit CydC [Methylopila sp. Yamaguchi]GBD47937.1 transport ATP-binding protein CydC [Methylopila sp. Yamaguchi]
MIALLSFRRLFAAHAGRFVAALALSLATLAAGVALLGLSGWFLTAAFLASAAASFNLFGPSAAVRGLSMLRIASRYGEKLAGHDATLKVLAEIRGWTFRALGRGGLDLGRSLRRGDAVARLTADVDALDSVFIVAAGPLATGALIGLGLTALLGVLLPAAAPVYGLAMASALIGAPLLLVAATRRLGADAVRLSAELRMATLDALEGRADLVAFGATEAARRRSAAIAERLARVRRGLAARAGLASAAVAVCAGAGALGLLVASLEAHAAGALSGPLVVGLVLAALGGFEATAVVVRAIGKFGAAAAAAERLKTINDAVCPVAEALRPPPLPRGGGFAFDRVTYGYDTGRPVLRALSFSVAAGERVAIVGPSGAGKSTLAALLLRLADPQAGRVSVAGRDLREAASSDLLRRVALLEQHAPIFGGSARENLAIGDPFADDAALWAALRKARLDDVIAALHGGLDAPLGEAGGTLSAGQARRLCLARTLLSPAEILVLDEPTSGLDRATERAFLEDLGPATEGRTVLLITHAALPEGVADRTLRLVDGVAIEATP